MGLSTEWILTGKGPKKLQPEIIRTKPENEILQLLDEWLEEITNLDPGRKEWFRYQVEDTFPTFKEWLKQKESEEQEEDDTNRHVA